jgi:endonuclease/exonuclease/phosphatase family metal-dependent hydrolase
MSMRVAVVGSRWYGPLLVAWASRRRRQMIGGAPVPQGLLRSLRFLLFSVSICAAARAETLTIATYNIANYNLTDRMAEGVYRPQYPKPESEKAALRQVIRGLGADVLALQEVGGEAFLRELQRDLRGEGCDYPFSALLIAGDEPRHVAVLSRRPLVRVERHLDLPFNYLGSRGTVRRGLLEVGVEAGGKPLTLFVVHLKSRYTERADDPQAEAWRSAEAVAIRDRILDGQDPRTARFVVLGDFNASPRDRAMRAIQRRGERVICELVAVEDSRGDRWTHAYRRDDSYSRVDHVLVSPALTASVADQRGHIVDGAAVAAASDHRPVVLTLRWE